ncbi:MFS transporter [Streptomonospora nanhaiensis]|uniref:Putative MFS family arabinose efflux permease n=2 Tax=Streptomonospora nanhaiensis TaxID=1323731 RepID=A0A853BTC6_9ACTN|nr:MFS transporter [Streptomonospora nanhaiensis]NYI98184.1 putative MFS family arabinose efflux permease [Streptomonospora nanhaiensis]
MSDSTPATPATPPPRADGGPERGAPAGITVLLTSVMAFSMAQLFIVGALGPALVAELRMSTTMLGFTTTVGFATAALLSPLAGRVVDRFGARRCLVALLVLTALALASIGAARHYAVLLLAIALGGLPQALANPATNTVILAVVPPKRRGSVTGWKQSGVQMGAFAAGLPVAALAAVAGWRSAVACAAVAAAAAAVWAWRAVPAAPPRPAGGRPAAGRVPASVVWLAAFSLPLGGGLASINTYLPLFAADELGYLEFGAAVLVAVLGVCGIAGRVLWARLAGGDGARADRLPVVLAAGAVLGPVLIGVAPLVPGAGASAWAGAVAIGAFAVAANAVSMLIVMRRAAPGAAGRDSALVSAGFFAGFAVGPPVFGAVTEAWGFGAGWSAVAAQFVLAAAVALAWRAADRPAATA